MASWIKKRPNKVATPSSVFFFGDWKNGNQPTSVFSARIIPTDSYLGETWRSRSWSGQLLTYPIFPRWMTSYWTSGWGLIWTREFPTQPRGSPNSSIAGSSRTGAPPKKTWTQESRFGVVSQNLLRDGTWKWLAMGLDYHVWCHFSESSKNLTNS